MKTNHHFLRLTFFCLPFLFLMLPSKAQESNARGYIDAVQSFHKDLYLNDSDTLNVLVLMQLPLQDLMEINLVKPPKLNLKVQRNFRGTEIKEVPELELRKAPSLSEQFESIDVIDLYIKNFQKNVTLDVFDLIDLSIDDLASVPIQMKDKSSFNYVQSLSNTETHRMDDLVRAGMTDLGELLLYSPAFTYFFNDYTVSGGMGGVNDDLSSVKLTIDGREINSLYDQTAFISHQLGIGLVKKIHLISGPGNNLSLANTSGGTINIETEDYAGFGKRFGLGANYGTFGQKVVNFNFANNNSDFNFHGHFRASFSDSNSSFYTDFIQDSLAYSSRLLPFESNISEERPYKNDQHALSGGFHSNNDVVYFGAYFYSNKSGQKGLLSQNLFFDNDNSERRNGIMGYFGSNISIDEDHALNLEYQVNNERIWGRSVNRLNNPEIFDELYDSEDGLDSLLTPLQTDTLFTRYYSQKKSPGSFRHQLKANYFGEVSLPVQDIAFRGKLFINLGYLLDYNRILGLALSTSDPHPPLFTSADSISNQPDFYKFLRHEGYLTLSKSFLAENLFVSLGGRYAHHQNYGGDVFIRAAASYNYQNTSSVDVQFSQGWQEPSISDHYTINLSNEISLNQSLKPAKVNHFNLGLSHRLLFHHFFRAGYYLSIIENPLYYKSLFEVANRNGQVLTHQARFSFETKVQPMNGTVQYRFTHSDGTNFYRHRLLLGINAILKEMFVLNTSLNFYSNLNTEDGSPFVKEDIDLPSVFNLDLNLSTRNLYIDGDVKLTMSLSLKNILNQKHYVPNIFQSGPRQFLLPGRYFIGRLVFDF